MVDERSVGGNTESPEERHARAKRIEQAALAFSGYYNAEREPLDPAELEGAMAFTERLTWRSMAVTLLRVHKRAAAAEEAVIVQRMDLHRAAERLAEIGDKCPSAAREDIRRAIGEVAAMLVLVAERLRTIPVAAPAQTPTSPDPRVVKVGDTVVAAEPATATSPATVAPGEGEPVGIVLKPDPLSVSTKHLINQGAKIAAEQRRAQGGGGS